MTILRPATATIAVGQFAGVPDPEKNIDTVHKAAAEAAGEGASLLLLPEAVMYDFTASGEQLAAAVEEYAEKVEGALADIASRHGIAIVAGLYAKGEGQLTSNMVVAWGAGGAELGRYEKLHLYDAFHYRESDKNQRARLKPDFRELCYFDLLGFRFGVMNCYDIRFPELARALVDHEIDVLLISAAWVSGPLKEFHWETLLQARAIENTCFVAAACQPPPICTGRSMILDPNGVTLASAAAAQDLIYAKISKQRLADVRKILPCLEHRRYAVIPR